MRSLLLTLMLFITLPLYAQKMDEPLSKAFLNKNIKIFDIRTKQEWLQSGMIKNSIPLTFFDEQGNYNLQSFIATIDKSIKKGETFALLCHSGSRSNLVSSFLGKQGYNVINLVGGIQTAPAQGITLVPYKAK